MCVYARIYPKYPLTHKPIGSALAARPLGVSPAPALSAGAALPLDQDKSRRWERGRGTEIRGCAAPCGTRSAVPRAAAGPCFFFFFSPAFNAGSDLVQ